MRDQDGDRLQREVGWGALESDALDRECDAALARYATVEARAGLEERILANLRAKPARITQPVRLRWAGIAAALAAVVAVALAIGWRPAKPAQITAQHQVSIGTPGPQSGTRLAENREQVIRSYKPRPLRTAMRRSSTSSLETADEPKLDQFPSPQPLSEQEKILASYVIEHHTQAILVARAWAGALRQDLAEEMTETSAPANAAVSGSPESRQTDR